LILSEIDLSVARWCGRCRHHRRADLESEQLPWWAGVIVGLAASALIGAFQGTLITRLHLPASSSPCRTARLGRRADLHLRRRQGRGRGVISLANNTPVYQLVNSNMSRSPPGSS